MVPDFRWNKSKEWTERARAGWRQNTPSKHCPRRAGTCWELHVEWGIVGPDRQWPRLVEFRFGVGLKYPAHMAKRRWWHARDEIDPVNQPIGQRTQARIIVCLKSFPANARHAERINRSRRRSLPKGHPGGERCECGAKAVAGDEKRFL